jgi:hypothetical protein
MPKVWDTMNKHLQTHLDQLDCPFPIDLVHIKWQDVQNIISCDDYKRTVIVKTATDKYLVNVPNVLYDSVFKSGEQNIIDADLGFDENY